MADFVAEILAGLGRNLVGVQLEPGRRVQENGPGRGAKPSDHVLVNFHHGGGELTRAHEDDVAFRGHVMNTLRECFPSWKLEAEAQSWKMTTLLIFMRAIYPDSFRSCLSSEMVLDLDRQHEPLSMMEHGPAVRFVDGYGAFAVHCPLAFGPVIQQAGFLIDSDQKRPR